VSIPDEDATEILEIIVRMIRTKSSKKGKDRMKVLLYYPLLVRRTPAPSRTDDFEDLLYFRLHNVLLIDGLLRFYHCIVGAS